MKTITYSNTSIKNEIIYEQKQLRKVLERARFRDYLIVLSDVRNSDTVKAFQLRCKMMITTRHTDITDHIPYEYKKMIKINSGFTLEESYELMAKALNRKLGTLMDYKAQCKQLHDISSGHPFIMSLIGKAFIANDYETKERRLSRFEEWIKALSNYDLTEPDIGAPIFETLKTLPENYREYYKSLVIFTDNVHIPIRVLKKYWGQSSDSDTEKIVSKFHKNSLLDFGIKKTEPVVSMHYIYYTYLKNNCSVDYIRECHKKFIESYRVSDIFDNRKELDLDFENDGYFHYHIGIHLREAEMDDLLSKLYLDFSFLEQKMKFSGLPNTIGDLKKYRNIIAGKCVDRLKFINGLIDFLPSTEEIIYKSSDTTLLQYSLTSNNNLIKEHAMKAAVELPNRLWFFDIDHSAKQTQIIRTPNIPKFVKFRTHDSALIYMVDGSIYYQDLSVDYSNEPVLYTGSNQKLIDIQLLDPFFFTLDSDGILKVYEFPIVMNMKGVSQYTINGHPVGSEPICTYQDKKFRITCFRVIKKEGVQSNDADVVCCLENGQIRLITWIFTSKKYFSVRILVSNNLL